MRIKGKELKSHSHRSPERLIQLCGNYIFSRGSNLEHCIEIFPLNWGDQLGTQCKIKIWKGHANDDDDDDDGDDDCCCYCMLPPSQRMVPAYCFKLQFQVYCHIGYSCISIYHIKYLALRCQLNFFMHKSNWLCSDCWLFSVSSYLSSASQPKNALSVRWLVLSMSLIPKALTVSCQQK